jgi:uncharacterized protein YbaP (TraB family)
VLWRVTYKGASPSHVFGTIHEPAALPAPAGAAFDASKTLLVEFMPETWSRERFLEAALLPEGRSLAELIGAEDFERAAAQIALPRELVMRLKPWAALINLRGDASGDAATLDGELAARARSRRMPVFQMEGVEEQIFTFDEAPLESQLALLKHSLAHRAELIELAERTRAAWLERDLASIARLRREFAARHPAIARHQEVMTRRIVHDRSVVMAFRMQRELRRGDAFVAVGALHLHGAQGVLALLEQDGFRSSRVY